MSSSRPVGQYLTRYAAPEASAASGVRAVYDRAVVIPAKAESAAFLEGLAPAVGGGERVLAIAVINAREDDPPDVHAKNDALARDLLARCAEIHPIAAGITTGTLAEPPGLDLALLDRFSAGRRLPPREGVGTARGAGCDFALALRARGRLLSRWIHTTDADATLPPAYFSAADAAPAEAAALAYPFWHETSESPAGDALALYEIQLRYYVLGLAAAGSPYAFHTLGSTIAADAEAYAAVRGVPRRRAGEDFYLLGKLAKLAAIVTPAAAPIRLRERLSARAPVGTGPAAREIEAAIGAGDPFRLHDPRSFAVLAAAMRAARARAQGAGSGAWSAHAPTSSAELRAAYEAAIAALGEDAALRRAAEASPSAAARRARDWLDALRTFKLIRAAGRAGLAPIPWRRALASAEFLDGVVDPGAPLCEIREALRRAEPRAAGAAPRQTGRA